MLPQANQPKTKPAFILRGRLWHIALAVGALLGFAGTIGTLNHTDLSQAINLSTSHQPERFTELYFNNPETLPKQIKARVPASFSYHITNHEAKDITYLARVTIVENGRLRVLQQDNFVIKDGAGHNVTVDFTTTRPNAHLELIIDLTNQGESIHFRSQS